MRILRLTLLTAAVITVFATGAAAGDLTGKIGVTPQVGLVIPIQALQQENGGGNAKLGFVGGLTAEYFINQNIAVGGRFMFNRFGLDKIDDVEFDGNWTIMEMGVFGKYVFLPDEMTRPFARVGVVMGKAKLEVDSDEADYAMTPGVELAGGVIHEVKENICVYGEIGWTYLATDGADVDVTQNSHTSTGESLINIQWVGVKAGATFFFGAK